MKLVPLTIDSPENLILASIFEEVFPPEERISIEDLYRPSQLDGYAVLGISFHGEIIGFLAFFRQDNLIYLCFFGVAPKHQNRRYGSMALQLLREQYPHCILLADIEKEDFSAANIGQRKRRKQFYKRNGFWETGWNLFYMNTEFELLCSDDAFAIQSFLSILYRLQEVVPEFQFRCFQK